MNDLLIYLLKAAMIQCLLPACYRLLMQRDTFHKMVRFYFMGGLVFSYIAPLIHFNFRILPPEQNITAVPDIPMIFTVRYQYAETHHATAQWWQQYAFTDILMTVLVAGMTVMLIRFVIRCLNLRRLHVSQRFRHGTYSILNVSMPIKPFSFGNRIYINAELHTAKELDEIVRHELVHVNQRHSIDIILATVNRIIFWWNPFVAILNSDIRNNLEYIVDDEMLQNGINRKHYQYSILNISRMTYINGIANYFNLHNLKKRIEMMNKEKTQPVYKIKWLLLLPVALLILLSLNMKRAIATNADFAVSSETVEPEPELIAESDTVANTGKGIIGKYDSDSLNIPLFVIDGKESHWTELENLSQELIYSFRILKEDTAIKLYGEKGKNGVMFIVTKGENVPKLSEDSTAKTYFFEPVDNINVVVKKAASFKKPLIIFDGKEKNIDIHNIDHQSIRSVTVLKNENATKLYGKNGENGVVIIKTKNAEP